MFSRAGYSFLNNSNSAQAEFFCYMLKNIKNKILITLGIIIILICIFLFISKKNNSLNKKGVTNSPTSQNVREIVKEKKVTNDLITLEINNIKYQDQIKTEISIADFMEKLKQEGKIDFEEKNYIGMGKFIESINGVKNGEKNWIYYVNGKKANIGMSNYKINQGDIVSWKYEKSY